MSGRADEVAVVVLAAGAGRRLGGAAKALLPAGPGATFLSRIAELAAAAGAGRAVVVAGRPHGESVAALARRLDLDVADNPDPDRGMSSSVAIGFEHAARCFPAARAALLWPVDHARVAADTVRMLVAEAAPDLILVPTWGGRGGHPTAFGRALWAELAACGDLPRGARSVLDRHAARVRRIDVPDPGVVADVDLPGDVPSR